MLLLDDGEDAPHVRTLSLGTRKVTFDGVRTVTSVPVQMALVVDAAEGDYLISDILEARVRQSLSRPEFKDRFRRWLDADSETEMTGGVMYFVGYNENFTNYRAVAGESIFTIPATERLRIGLAHGGEDDDARDFDAYRLRITDGDGDVVPEGDDVPTVAAATVRRGRFNYSNTHPLAGQLIAPDTAMTPFSNVRINDNGQIQTPIHDGGPRPASNFFASSIGVPISLGDLPLNFIQVGFRFDNHVHVDYPDEFRDFPTDTLASDETYTLAGWAVNEAGEVISPVQSLWVHPVDTVLRNIITGNFINYLDVINTGVTSLHATQFTILE